jgi:hypothetical protein
MAAGANPIFRMYQSAGSAAENTAVNVTGLVPANRVLIVSKLTVTSIIPASHNITIIIQATNGSGYYIANAVPLVPGDVWTETGLIIPAGQGIWIATNLANAGGTDHTTVFGEEVDAT